MANNMNIEDKLSDRETKSVTEDYNIPVTIRNASSVGFTSAKVAIKDEQTNTVKEANFGRIASKTTSTQNVSMPGGVEQAAYEIFPEVGERLFGMGFADNAPAVNITISD